MHAHTPIFSGIKRFISQIMIAAFVLSSVVPPGPVMAQTAGIELPEPRQMLEATPQYRPAVITGVVVHPENPLEFDFIIDTADSGLRDERLAAETNRLVKYFLTALTIPEEEMWVNLSPYEDNRIIAERFGETAMGHDLLAQDYILKQLTSSLMYPEKELGSEFWTRVHQKAQAKFGTTDIPMNTFNKVWIVPDTATIYEKNNTAFILESRLKVMLEEDYVALSANVEGRGLDLPTAGGDKIVSGVSSAVIREVIIPEIEKEINHGRHFAALRQIYHSLVLAAWYKTNLQETLLSQVYVNRNKTRGVNLPDPAVNQEIYARYVEAFQKGVYDFIREDYDTATDRVIPRRYFSGGGDMRAVRDVVRRGTIKADGPVDGALLARIQPLIREAMETRYVSSTVRLYDVGAGSTETDLDGLQDFAAPDAAVLALAERYGVISQILFDDYRWHLISTEAKLHSERNGLGVEGQEDWFRNHFADWIDTHLGSPIYDGVRLGAKAQIQNFVEDVNLFKWSINESYKFDLGFSHVARAYLYRLYEFERLQTRKMSVAEEIMAYSEDTELKSLIGPLVDGKLPVFADVVLESLIPALAREGNDPNAQVALGAGGLGFLDGETVAGIKEHLKGNWGATDGYAGFSALPLYEVFQRRTISAQEVDWDNQQDIRPFMVTDAKGKSRHMSFKVNFTGKIHHESRDIHIRDDLQKKLKLSADQVSRFWHKLIEMGVIEEVSKRGRINGTRIKDVLRAHRHAFDGREQDVYDLLVALDAQTRPEGKAYEVQVYIVNNEGTPQFGLRAPKFDIFHHLYPGGDQQWIQYAFYGKAYVQLMRELGVAPDVIMLNEGQTVFAAIEMINDINRAKLLGTRSMFENVKIVYKTHTPNPAALPIYSDVARLRGMLGWDMVPNDLLTEMYGQTMFYAPKALADLADLIIAVSDENAQVARRIIVPGFDVEGAQNGSMPQDWYPDVLAERVAERGYEAVTGQELYDIRRDAKLALNDNLRRLLGDVMGVENVPQFDDLEGRPLVGLLRRMVRYKGQGMLIPLIEWIVGDPQTQYFDFNDKLLGYGQGANLLLGGEAQDEYGEEWVKRFKRMQAGAFTVEDLAEIDNLTRDQILQVWHILRQDGLIRPKAGGYVASGNWRLLETADAEIDGQNVADRYKGYHTFLFKMFQRMENLKGKVIYIEKTGKNVMKAATTAVDLWLSMPDPTQEASGTSHQRVGLAGGLNVGVKGAGFDIQINHGVNGWIIDAFPGTSTEELIDMFNVGVRSEHREEVQRNMHDYWNRARPLLRDYISEAVMLYRAFVDSQESGSVDTRWTDMLKSAFDQAHETVTIAHNNIRNKMAFDAALDGSGTKGIRRRKALGEDILIAMGPVINLLVEMQLSGTEADQIAERIQAVSPYLAQVQGAGQIPEAFAAGADVVNDARAKIGAAVEKGTRSAEDIANLLAEELAIVVPFRVSRAADNAILVVDENVTDVAETPMTLDRYHAVGGEVVPFEVTYDPATGRTRFVSMGRVGVVPYFNILVEGDRQEMETDDIIALYEGGGYISESSTRLTKTAVLDGREITLVSRYDAQSNRTTHRFDGISDGPRRDRLAGFELTEPEPGFFVQRTGAEILALRAKGYYPDSALLGAESAAAVTGGEQKYGGIDLNIQLLDLQIKRDDAGVPLPVHHQPVEQMHIDGFVPVIINVVPINNLPMLLGWQGDGAGETQRVTRHHPERVDADREKRS